MTTLVRILDHNSFSATLLARVFTHDEDARTWASHQIISIRRELADKGEDLLDIEADFQHLALDDQSLVQGRSWGRWR